MSEFTVNLNEISDEVRRYHATKSSKQHCNTDCHRSEKKISLVQILMKKTLGENHRRFVGIASQAALLITDTFMPAKITNEK